MIDLAAQTHRRFHFHGLSGDALDVEDPASVADFSPQSLRASAMRFRGQQAMYRFDNASYQYEQQTPAMQEAAHVLTSSFDFEAVHAALTDPVMARRDAAIGVLADALSPSASGPHLAQGLRLS